MRWGTKTLRHIFKLYSTKTRKSRNGGGFEWQTSQTRTKNLFLASQKKYWLTSLKRTLSTTQALLSIVCTQKTRLLKLYTNFLTLRRSKLSNVQLYLLKLTLPILAGYSGHGCTANTARTNTNLSCKAGKITKATWPKKQPGKPNAPKRKQRSFELCGPFLA